MSDWMTDDIRALKAKRRKNEVIWRKNPLFVNFDQNKLFNINKTLLGRQNKLVLPDYSDPITLASTFNMYFIDKIGNIRAEFPLLESCCCLPTPMTLASGGSPMFPHVVHQPASPSIWPAVQSLRRGLSTNPGVTMWCVCGCS